jgi:hypothetical protein
MSEMCRLSSMHGKASASYILLGKYYKKELPFGSEIRQDSNIIVDL